MLLLSLSFLPVSSAGCSWSFLQFLSLSSPMHLRRYLFLSLLFGFPSFESGVFLTASAAPSPSSPSASPPPPAPSRPSGGWSSPTPELCPAWRSLGQALPVPKWKETQAKHRWSKQHRTHVAKKNSIKNTCGIFSKYAHKQTNYGTKTNSDALWSSTSLHTQNAREHVHTVIKYILFMGVFRSTTAYFTNIKLLHTPINRVHIKVHKVDRCRKSLLHRKRKCKLP